MKNYILLFFMFVLNCLVMFAQEVPKQNLSVNEMASQNFTFEDVKIGMKLKDFLSKYTSAKMHKDDTNHKLDKVAYIVNAKSADFVLYVFHKDVLYEMVIVYSAAQVQEMGGDFELLTRLVKKFGEYSEDNYIYKRNPYKVDVRWEFDKTDRVVYAIFKKEFSKISITDSKTLKLVQSLQSKAAKTGFDDH